MKISDYAVKNYQFTLIMFIMVIVLGVTTIVNMPRSEDPDMHAPQFPVVAVYPGTSPKDMEELVVNPLEKRIFGLENIKRIKTSILDGVAVLDVEYKYGSNVDDKYAELVREVNSIRSELPRDLAKLEVRKVAPSDVNILQMALVSDNASRSLLQQTAERLQEALEKVPSLKKVEISGIPQRIVRVDLHLDKMAQMRLTAEQVFQAIQLESANIPGGSIQENSKSYNIKTSGNFKNLEEIQRCVVFSFNGRNVLLQDVANVYFDYEPEKHITRLNRHRAVFISAAQKAGENISKTKDQYLPVLDQFRKTLPANIDLVVNFDQADNVSRRLGGLGMDFLLAILLVSITLLPLGIRAATVVMISIPLSLAIGVILLNLLGYNLNQLSIVGLVVALGLLVDDSIVVVENIERWLREGHTKMEATLKATQQIGMAVLGCTVTLIIAFLPLVFLPESSGDFIRSLPMAVITAIIASMLVSLTIVPFLSSRLLKHHTGHPDGNIFLRSLKKLISGSYTRLLDMALQKPVWALIIAGILFIGSLQLFPVIGFSLFPASEKPQFVVNIIAPLQSNLQYTDSVSRVIEQELDHIPEVKFISSNTGKGNPRVYYNVLPQNERSDFAQLFVQLDENTRPSRKLEIIESLRAKWTPYPGAKIEVKNFEQGPPVVAPVEVRLFGDNLDTLRALSLQTEQMLETTPGTIYVNNPVKNLKSDISVKIDQEKAQSLGVPSIHIDRAVRMAISGLEAAKFTNAEGDEYKILVGTPHPMYPSLNAFSNLYITNLQGQSIPLDQLAGLKLQTSPLSINHLNKTRSVSVSASVKKGYLNETVIQSVIQKMNLLKLPTGYRYEMGGEVETRKESFGGFGSIIIFTVFLFIAVLILEFKTFKSTLIVLSVIPLGMVGALVALWLTGNSMSFVATIGMIALAGIEVKNTILLVDFTNQLREEGMDINQAILEAGEVRFLPIILTTLTAIGGLLPIAISTNPLIAPLAVVMIGGLISSTLLSRVVTPVIYKLIPPAIQKTAASAKK